MSAEWAELLRELLIKGGYVNRLGDPSPETATFATGGPVPGTARTIRRWLAGGSATGESIRDTCRALGYPTLRGLVRAGWLTAEEVSLLPPEPAPLGRHALWIDAIARGADVPPYARGFVLSMVDAMRAYVETLTTTDPRSVPEPRRLLS
jgi:hypothetical protein